MGEAKRKRNSQVAPVTPKSSAQLEIENHITQMFDAAGTGTETRVWNVDVLFTHNLLYLFDNSTDQRELALGRACVDVIRQMQSANPPILCALCGHEFETGLPFSIVFLSVDQHINAFGNGVCEACSLKPQLMNRITDFYNKYIFAGSLRVLEEVGHA